MIAEELISRQKDLTQKNRISWIILDSTVEIACKEYLLYEKKNTEWSDSTIRSKKRHEIQKEVEKDILTGDLIWSRFKHYYMLRNEFIHRKTGVHVFDEDIDDFERT